MNNTAIFQGLIRSRPPDLAQVQRQHTLLRSLFLLYSLLVSLAIGAFAWFLLWKLTETDQWEGFWSASSWGVILLLSVPPFVLLLLPAIFLVRQGHDAETATRALPLREAARHGDDTTSPLDAQQPTTAEHADWMSSSAWQARLRRADPSAQNYRLMLGGVLSALATYAEIAHGLADLLSDFGSVAVVITLAALPFLGVGLVFLLWGLLTPDKMRVTATQDGLEWRQLHVWRPGTTAHLSSDQAQAFFTFQYSQLSSSRREPLQRWRIYVLDAPEATLAWKVNDSKPVHQDEQVAHERLVGMILAHTRLPLRTLTAAADNLARLPSKAAREENTIAGTLAADEAMRLSPVGVLPSHPRRQGVGVRARTLFVLPALLLLAFPSAVWGVQTVRAHSYETLLAQAHAHKPLYYDAMKHPTGDWPIQNDDGDYSGSFGYSGGSYQMTGGYGMLATTPAIYGDVLVEVTAHFSGDIQAHQYDDLGLALHTSDQESTEILFIVDSLGQWSIGPYPDAPVRDTGEIKGGLGTPNRLSVLMHGQEYLCFINGTFVGGYQADHPSLGHVGIFYGGQALVASFNDFTVYPL